MEKGESESGKRKERVKREKRAKKCEGGEEKRGEEEEKKKQERRGRGRGRDPGRQGREKKLSSKIGEWRGGRREKSEQVKSEDPILF